MLPPVTRKRRNKTPHKTRAAKENLLPPGNRSRRSDSGYDIDSLKSVASSTSSLPTMIPKLAKVVNATQRGVSRMQKKWKEMLDEGETDIAPQRGAVSLSRKLRTFFQMDFESQEFAKYLYFLGRHPLDAWRFKLNLDFGGDSLKTLVQVLFDDDPLKTHDFSRLEEGKSARDGNFGLLQSGVNGVLVVLDAEGASESHDVVLDFLDRLSDGITKTRALLKNARFKICVDLKMTPFIIGIQSVSSRRPLTTSEWSPYKDHSHPEIRRTFAGIQRDLRNYQRALMRGKTEPKDYKSVSHRLPKFLENEGKSFVEEIVAPPQNHVFAGVTAWFLLALMYLCKELALKWSKEAGIKRQVRHGRILLKGNDARKLLRCVHILEKLIPRFEDDIGVIQCNAIEKMIPCLQYVDKVVHDTMGPVLRQTWRSNIQELIKAYARFKAVYETVKVPPKGRDTMSHKFQVLTVDVPRYLDLHSEGKYSLSPDAEQPFEHCHVKVSEHISNYSLPNWEADPAGEKLSDLVCSGCGCECCRDKPKRITVAWQEANPATVERHRKLRRMAIAS